MRTFKLIRAFVLACSIFLVVGVSAALFNHSNDHRLLLRPESGRAEGTWDIDLDAYRSQRRNGLQVEIREKRSTHSFYLPSERVPVIPNTKNGSPIQFTMASDAGELRFTGEVQRDIASGRYQFVPNKEFAAEAGRLLKRELSNDDLLELTWSDVTLVYIKEIAGSGIAINYEDVLALRRHGVKSDAVKEFVQAGVEKPREIIQLRNHGVKPEFVREARALAFAKSVDEVIRLRNHGVSIDYLQGWKNVGVSYSADDLVRLRNFGVNPEYGAAWKKAGFDFTPEELIRAKSFGVPSDFAAALASEGKRPTLEEIIRLRQFGVNADYYRDIKEANPKFTSDEIVRFRQHGVQSDYVKILMKNEAPFTAEQIVNLRNHGVPADYVAAVNVEGRAPLDAKAIIELRNRGVSAETARKLRQ